MKAIVVYYSYTGHAKRVAESFERALAVRGDVTVERLVPVDEITTFAGQCRAAFTRRRAKLAPGVTTDLSPYELIVIGCPVWAFAPVPAVNTWLDTINGLAGKRAIVFLTSGSGAGVGKCFRNIRTVLEHKGIAHTGEVNIPDRRLDDGTFVDTSIAKAIQEAVL